MATTRLVEPGDNRLGMDVLVPAQTFLRGIKAARHFADKKDESETYSCVRIAPGADAVTITAANPISMFFTRAQTFEPAYNDAGVVDLPVWMVDQILTVFRPRTMDDELRITTHADSEVVKIAESTGLFSVNVHQWPRKFMSENAPDVPVILGEVFKLEPLLQRPQVISPTVAHQVLQATKIMQTEFVIDQSEHHYRFRIGGHASAIAAVPDQITDDDKPEIQEDEGHSGLRLVTATPPDGLA